MQLSRKHARNRLNYPLVFSSIQSSSQKVTVKYMYVCSFGSIPYIYYIHRYHLSTVLVDYMLIIRMTRQQLIYV